MLAVLALVAASRRRSYLLTACVLLCNCLYESTGYGGMHFNIDVSRCPVPVIMNANDMSTVITQTCSLA